MGLDVLQDSSFILYFHLLSTFQMSVDVSKPWSKIIVQLGFPGRLLSIFYKICKLYIKGLLCAALNSHLNGFAPGEEIFSEKPFKKRRALLF